MQILEYFFDYYSLHARLTANIRHGVKEKVDEKDEQQKGQLFRKNRKIKGVYQL